MRLGQLSRKLDIKPSEIASFIKSEFNTDVDQDLNTRLEDQHVEALEKKFGSEIKTESDHTHTVHSPIEVPHYHEASHETAVASTNEKDPFIPLPVDPDAELIKAPKIKLDGLKVVGKIELPQKKQKEEIVAVEENSELVQAEVSPDQVETVVKESQPAKSRNKKTATVPEEEEEYSIYKDKKGIYHFSKTQKDNRKNSLERIKREKIEEQRKISKVKHYKQIASSEKPVAVNTRKNKKQAERQLKKQTETVQRKGIWGKFINWLNG
jgi:hypothetical protein